MEKKTKQTLHSHSHMEEEEAEEEAASEDGPHFELNHCASWEGSHNSQHCLKSWWAKPKA